MKKINWYTASEISHPANYQDQEFTKLLKDKFSKTIYIPEFKYAKWYEIMVITKNSKVISNIFYNDGALYRDFDGIFGEESQDWNTMCISNDEGNFRLPWIKVDKWCYMEDVIIRALEDFDPKYIPEN